MARKVLDMVTFRKCGPRNNVLCYILISALIFLQVSQCLTASEKKGSVCTTPQCQKLAGYYKKIINPRGNPCNDFYDYVCHGWGAVHPRPIYRNLWAVHEHLGLRALIDTKKLLESSSKTGAKDEDDAKFLYRSCMNLPSLEKLPAEHLKSIMQSVGNWPMFLRDDVLKRHDIFWQYVDKKYMNIAGESALFDYYLKGNTITTHFYVEPVLKQLFSPYGMMKRETNWDAKDEKKHYKAFLIKIINSVAPADPKNFKSIIEKDVDDVIKFREQLRQATSENLWLNYIGVTIADLQKKYDTATANRPVAKIDWLTTIRSMYKDSKDSYGEPINNETVIRVQTQYFSSLAAILANSNNRVIGNHVHLYFAERHILLNEDLESDLKKSAIDERNVTGYIRYEPDRWMFCMSNHEMKVPIGRMYVNYHFSTPKKAAVNHMVSIGDSILQKQMSESTWLGPALEKKWIHKFDHLDTQIGYPNWYYENLESSPTASVDVNPTGVDIQYVPTLNRIGISASYLQWPVFDETVPFVIQYGALLPTIGHELYHGFDYEGFNRSTRVLQNLIEEHKANDEFAKRAKCFRDQYIEYRLKEIKKRKLSKKFEFPSTLEEDIPDVMGLKLAYRGYKDQLWLAKGNCPILPGFEEFGCDKLFFIAYASSLCADISPKAETKIVLSDEHSLPPIRVNGAVANMKEFAQTFGCKSSDALVLKKTCDLWQ